MALRYRAGMLFFSSPPDDSKYKSNRRTTEHLDSDSTGMLIHLFFSGLAQLSPRTPGSTTRPWQAFPWSSYTTVSWFTLSGWKKPDTVDRFVCSSFLLDSFRFDVWLHLGQHVGLVVSSAVSQHEGHGFNPRLGPGVFLFGVGMFLCLHRFFLCAFLTQKKIHAC